MRFSGGELHLKRGFRFVRSVRVTSEIADLSGASEMTHTRNTPASEAPPADTRAGRPHLRQPRVRRQRTFPAEGSARRAYRAAAEPMTVRPLRDGRYVVESEGGTYVVDAERETCTCPDSAIRGARCKHIRRVAIEIESGLVPAPDERERVCAVCGGLTFAPVDQDGPALCDRHDHDPGDLVRDRETGALLVVVDRIGDRADEVRTGEGRLVSEYETNAAYGDHEPVFAVVYVESLPAGDAVDDFGTWVNALRDSRRYLFPASRLTRVELRAGDEEGGKSGEADAGPYSGRTSGTTGAETQRA